MVVLCFWAKAEESEEMSARARLREPLLWAVKMVEESLEVRERPLVLVVLAEGAEMRE